MRVWNGQKTMVVHHDLRRNPGQDWVAESLLRHLRFSLLANKEAFNFLPHFKGL
jgi:hypothetical protein